MINPNIHDDQLLSKKKKKKKQPGQPDGLARCIRGVGRFIDLGPNSHWMMSETSGLTMKSGDEMEDSCGFHGKILELNGDSMGD